jgi:hypothetical protein
MIRLDKRAETLLREWAPGKKMLGRMIAQLVFAEEARMHERGKARHQASIMDE